MRDNYSEFQSAGATVVAIAKDEAKNLAAYWAKEAIPFAVIPDPEGRLGKLYRQQSKLGLMPAVFVVDKGGALRLAHYGADMADIPTAAELLDIVKAP